MKSSHRNTVLVRVQFSGRHPAIPVLEDLGRTLAASVNVHRGRITLEDATFELEVTGPTQRIQEITRGNGLILTRRRNSNDPLSIPRGPGGPLGISLERVSVSDKN